MPVTPRSAVRGDRSAARRARRAALVALAPTVAAASIVFAPTAAAEDVSDYARLPLTNRLADAGPGGVDPALPTDVAALESLVRAARATGRPMSDFAALLFQYRLAQATTAAGIDLAGWAPSAGFRANRENMVRSYRYYEDLQLGHRELQWAGMGGMVGADFGGGIEDFDTMTAVYDLPGLQRTAAAVIERVRSAFGPDAVDALPEGLRRLAEHGDRITPDDLRWFIGQVVTMQKAIFSDLMPMHYAYVHEGMAAIEEFHAAGLIPDDILAAWYDVASGDPDRVAAGNARLLQREQGTVVAGTWDAVRAYKDGLGSALTYAMTLAATPSVAGVLPPRAVDPIEIRGTLPDGRTATLHTPLPSWDWSVYPERWAYVEGELLPKYRYQVENNWPALEAILGQPYEVQWQRGRPMLNLPALLGDVAGATYVTVD